MTIPLGFIGTGSLGGEMARRLLDAGYPVIVLDPNPAAVTPLKERGAKVAATPREVADTAEIVFATLPSAKVSREVALGPDGVVKGKAVKIYVEMSTIGKAEIMAIEEGLRPSGIGLLDAPVTGGRPRAREGKLAMIVSGAPELYERARPVLSILAHKIFYVSEKAGLSQVAKVVNNIVSGAGKVASFEAVVTAVKAGINARMMIDIINAGTGRNVTTADKFPAAILNRTFKYGGQLRNGLKDAQLFLDEAKSLGVHLWVTPKVLEMYQDAAANGYLEGDGMGIYKFVQKLAGLDPDAQVPEPEHPKKDAATG